MSTTTQVSRNKNILYFAIGSTVAFMLYITFVLTPVGACFNLDSGSNSLGLSFSYTKDIVLSFFVIANSFKFGMQFLQLFIHLCMLRGLCGSLIIRDG